MEISSSIIDGRIQMCTSFYFWRKNNQQTTLSYKPSVVVKGKELKKIETKKWNSTEFDTTGNLQVRYINTKKKKCS